MRENELIILLVKIRLPILVLLKYAYGYSRFIFPCFMSMRAFPLIMLMQTSMADLSIYTSKISLCAFINILNSKIVWSKLTSESMPYSSNVNVFFCFLGAERGKA